MKFEKKDYIPYGVQSIDDSDIEEVVNVLRSDWITTGPKVEEFEQEISNYIGCKNSTVVNSGTSALDIAIKTLELEPKSEIITTPFTFMATSNAILYNNLIPVFADINRETRNIEPEEIKKKITENTKAIIYMDYAGHPCNISEIKDLAYENDLYLIEDACHALGSEYHGDKIGKLADMTAFSFHPVKNITTGEGGAVTTNNSKFDENLKSLRNHGIDTDLHKRQSSSDYIYDMKFLGRNYRLTDFQCALGISQLKKLDKFIQKRQKIARSYSKQLNNIDFIETPLIKPAIKHSWHIYTVLLDKEIERDKFFKYMRDYNIGVNVHYIPIYHFSYYKKHFDFQPEEFPVTEEVFKSIITLPLHPRLSDEQFDYICSKVESFEMR